MNTSAKFNALFRDVSVGALSALTIGNQACGTLKVTPDGFLRNIGEHVS